MELKIDNNFKIILLLGILLLISIYFIPVRWAIFIFFINVIFLTEYFSKKEIKFRNIFISELLIPFLIFSKSKNTPTFQFDNRNEYWSFGKLSRLNGPAIEYHNGSKQWWLNDKRYDNVHDWLKDHPNQDNAFQVEMLLKWS
jgi:hypothetical protein